MQSTIQRFVDLSQRIFFVRVSQAAAALMTVCLAVTLAFAAQQSPAEPTKAAEPIEAEASSEEAADVGLRGILPAEVPDGLEQEEFTMLAGNWADWSTQTGEIVFKLYEGDELDLPAQREVVDSLRTRLASMEQALSDQRYRSIWNPLTTLHGRLARRVEMAEAVLGTLELTPEKVRASQLQAAGAGITQALQKLETKLRSISGGAAWLPFVEAGKLTELMKNPEETETALPVLQQVRENLKVSDKHGTAQKAFLNRDEFVALNRAIGVYIDRTTEKPPPLDTGRLRAELARLVESVERFEREGKLSAAGGVKEALAAIGTLTPDKGARVAKVIDRYYMNHNFHIVSSEEFLSRYVAETRTERDKIGERMLGAWVSGNQTSTATTGIDLHKNDKGALFDLTLRGVVRSNTRSSTSRGSVTSAGRHTFIARRRVLFNGDNFTLGPKGVISINPSIRTTGASTKYDGGFGASTARRKAYRIAASRRGEGERIASNKIRKRVLPEFDEEVENEFKQANLDIEKQWNRRLKEAQLEPAERDVHSTDKHLFWSSRVSRKGELAGGATTLPPPPAKGLTIHVHETLLNAMFDRMNIAGRTMTNAEFEREVEDYFDILLGSGTTDPKPKADGAKTAENSEPDAAEKDLYVFAAVDPIRFHIEANELFLVIRTGIRQEGKEGIPTQKITVPLTFRLEGDQILIERGSVKVAPVARSKSRFKQIARAKVMSKKIQKDLANSTRERKINLSRGEGKSDLVLSVSKISALDGWLTISAE